MSSQRTSQGQVLLISAFAMVVLIAIAAIVVDLGFSWMLRRHEQNAADPGALAAAKWIRDEADPALRQAKMEAEACFYAQENGFFEGDASCAAALAAGNLDVNYPPATTMAGQFQGHFGYVEVIIEDDHPSFFGQFFGQPFATVRTAAVAALTTGNSNSSSLVALGDACTGNDGGDSAISGGADVNIFPAAGVPPNSGGFVNVNAACGTDNDLCQNGSGQAALSISGELSAPYTFVVGNCAYNGSGTPQPECTGTSPCLEEGTIPLGDPLSGAPEPWPLLNLPAPNCPRASEPNTPTDGQPCTLRGGAGWCPDDATGQPVCTMEPGVYYAGWDVRSNVRVVLKPGMYVFAGFGIQLNNSSSLETVTGLDASGNLIDARVTIFSTDGPGCPTLTKQCQGSINISANGALRLHATDSTSCLQVSPAICPWAGILLWQDGSVNGEPQAVNITGSSDLLLSGTIYAPESGVLISGGNDSTGCTDDGDPNTPLFCLAIQIISESWNISGNSTVDMPYDPSELYQLEQRGLVH